MEDSTKRKWTVRRVVGTIAAVLVGAVTIYPSLKYIQSEFFKPRIVYFEVMPKQIVRGESVNLRWEVAPEPKPDKVTLDEETVPLSGKTLISPEKDTTYVLVARNRNGEAREYQRVRVLPTPIRANFYADRTVVRQGESVTVAWEISDNADSAFIQPFFGAVEKKGERALVINGPTKLTLTAQGLAGTFTKELSINVLVTEAEFTIDPSTIHAGERATLKWKANATSVQIREVGKQEMGNFPPEGAREVSPISDTAYEVLASGPGGERRVTASIVVLPPLLPALRVLAQPERIVLGRSAQITWSCERCTKVEVAGIGEFAPSDSTSVTPSRVGTLEYQLTAVGPGGRTSQVARVVVIALAKPRMAVAGLEQAQGVRDPKGAAQSLTEQLTAFFHNSYEIVGAADHRGASVVDYTSVALLRMQTDRKARDFVVARMRRVEMTAQITIRVLRVADGVVVGEGSGKAKKAATLAWETPYVSGGSASPELRLEAEVVNLAVADALKKYVQIASPFSPAASPRLRVSLEPKEIPLGSSSTITWSSENCTVVEIERVGQFGPSGSVLVRPEGAGDVQYRVLGSGPGGKTEAQVLNLMVIAPSQPAPSSGRRRTIAIPAGTSLTVRLAEALSLEKNQAGTTFAAKLDSPLIVEGLVIAERHAQVEGRVVNADRRHGLVVELVAVRTADDQRVRIWTKALRADPPMITADTGISFSLVRPVTVTERIR